VFYFIHKHGFKYGHKLLHTLKLRAPKCWYRTCNNDARCVCYLLLRPRRGAEHCDQFVCLSVRQHISGTTGPIFPKFFRQISCGRGSVLLWRRSDTLCTSGFTDDVTFGHSGPYGDAWKAEPL